MKQEHEQTIEQIENTNGTYANCESRLRTLVNGKVTSQAVLMFFEVLQDCKNLGFNLSREYLKGLCMGTKDQKTNKISKLMVKRGLHEKPVFRYYTIRQGNGIIKTKQEFSQIVL